MGLADWHRKRCSHTTIAAVTANIAYIANDCWRQTICNDRTADRTYGIVAVNCAVAHVNIAIGVVAIIDNNRCRSGRTRWYNLFDLCRTDFHDCGTFLLFNYCSGLSNGQWCLRPGYLMNCRRSNLVCIEPNKCHV